MKNSDQKIEQGEKIILGFWNLVKLFGKELWEEVKDFFAIFKRNFFGKSNTHKIATIAFLILTVIPIVYSYKQVISGVYNYAYNVWYFDQNVVELQGKYGQSVKDFFHTYNQKYGVDCEWIKKVNVDMNMAILGTERKPGKFCSLNYRMQIYPITIENPITDGAQAVRVGGKAIVAIFNGSDLSNLWYQKYELWRKMEWSIEEWKFNPFPQDGKEKLK